MDKEWYKDLKTFLGNSKDDNHKEALKEIQECLKRSTNKKVSLQELNWADVLTDLMISLLPNASKRLRKLLNKMFKEICPNITVASIEQISLALLSSEIDIKNEVEEDIEEEEEDDDDEDDDDEVDNDDDKEDDNKEIDNEVVSDDEKKMTSDEEDLPDECDNLLREELRKALGSSIENGDEGDENSEEYLNDDEMFKLDDKIAQVFKEKFKANKEKKMKFLEQKNFKMRVLDMVGTISLRRDLSFKVFFQLSKSLISFISMVRKSKNEMLKISLKALANISQRKNTPIEKIKQKDIKDCFCRALNICSKNKQEIFQKSIAPYLSWLITMDKKINSSEWYIKLISDELKIFLEGKSFVSKNLFTRLIQSHQDIIIPITKVIEDHFLNHEINNYRFFIIYDIIIFSFNNASTEILSNKNFKQNIKNICKKSIDYIPITSKEKKNTNLIGELLEFIMLFKKKFNKLPIKSEEMFIVMKEINIKKINLSKQSKKDLKKFLSEQSEILTNI